MTFLEKSEAAKVKAAKSRAEAADLRRIADKCPVEFRAGYLRAADDAEMSACVDDNFAMMCEQWHAAGAVPAQTAA